MTDPIPDVEADPADLQEQAEEVDRAPDNDADAVQRRLDPVEATLADAQEQAEEVVPESDLEAHR